MRHGAAPVFVVGSGRSGTSLVRAMLNAHPRLHLTHEASFYVDPRGNRLAGDADAWFARYRQLFPFRFLELSCAAVTDRFRSRPSPARADVVQAVMAEAAERRGKARFGDKTPSHARCLDAIVADFPDAKILHVVRNPVAVVASLERMPWATSSHGLNARFYAQQVREVGRFGGEVCTLRLEDVLADPEAEMRRALSFVGEDWDPAVLDHPAHGGGADTPPFPWFSDAGRPVTVMPDAIRAPTLSPAWTRIVERTASWAMRAHGYDPARMEHEPTTRERAATHATDALEVARTARRSTRAASLWLRSEPPPADEALAAVLAINPAAWSHYPGFRVPPVPPETP
jgi:hypothetical protein